MFSEFQALRSGELFFVFAVMSIVLQLNSDNCIGWRLEVIIEKGDEVALKQ